MRKYTFLPIAFACLILVLALTPAQAKSDFSGSWKLDTAKSDFGPMPPPDSITEQIVHEDPNMKIHFVQVGGTGDATYAMAYTTDGKESVNKMGDNEFKTTLAWDGEDLVGNTKGSYEGNEFSSKDRWNLGEGGKTMTLSRHITTSMGDLDMKFVFSKQ